MHTKVEIHHQQCHWQQGKTKPEHTQHVRLGPLLVLLAFEKDVIDKGVNCHFEQEVHTAQPHAHAQHLVGRELVEHLRLVILRVVEEQNA